MLTTKIKHNCEAGIDKVRCAGRMRLFNQFIRPTCGLIRLLKNQYFPPEVDKFSKTTRRHLRRTIILYKEMKFNLVNLN
jgi:hypothetical protein